MDKQNQFKGYVVFVLFNKGSKSEHYAPALVMEEGITTELFKEGDNPFACESLKPFHLAYCLVSGYIDNKKNLITVSTIEQIEDPAMGLWEKNGNTNL
jgi:hypothetical protein